LNVSEHSLAGMKEITYYAEARTEYYGA